MKTRLEQGFTLIELMIVVAIVAILAAIAYPSYEEYVRKSRRADAKAVLVEAAQFMERVYTEKFSYADAALPENLTKSPQDSDDVEFYTISLRDQDATSFTLEAVPQGKQDKDSCKTLVLRHTGKREVDDGATLSADDCWN